MKQSVGKAVTEEVGGIFDDGGVKVGKADVGEEVISLST